MDSEEAPSIFLIPDIEGRLCSKRISFVILKIEKIDGLYHDTITKQEMERLYAENDGRSNWIY